VIPLTSFNRKKLPTLLHIHGGWWVLSVSDGALRHIYGRRVVAQMLKEGMEVNVAEIDCTAMCCELARV
jgi:hypothetical protein